MSWRSSLNLMSVRKQLSAALDPDVAMAVDDNVGDAVVLQQRFEWAEPEHIVSGDFDQAIAIGFGQEQPVFPDQVVDDSPELDQQGAIAGLLEPAHVDFLQQPLLDAILEILEQLVAGIGGAGDAGGTLLRIEERRLRNRLMLFERGLQAID
jgi:hypothetical protein